MLGGSNLPGQVEAQEVGRGGEAEVVLFHEDLCLVDVGEGSVDGDGQEYCILLQPKPWG